MTENMYDLIIVGAGPAGLSAAIYMARAKYKVLVLEKEKMGGQITITSEVVNYPGIEKISGEKLTENMRRQAESFGASFQIAKVEEMELDRDIKELKTDKGVYKTFGVILAVGANPRRLGFEGEEKFKGRGVAYCATCDGEFFTGMNLFVIGGGFAAVEEGIFLTKYAKHVTMIVITDDFTCAKTVSDKVKDNNKITVRFNTELRRVEGDDMLKKVVFYDSKADEEWHYDADIEGSFGIFVFAGYTPNTKWLPPNIELNEQGYIITDRNQETNLDGVFAAGDVCEKNLRQVVTAVSDGAVAATSMEKYVSSIHEKLGIPDFTIPKREVAISDTNDEDSKEFLSDSIKENLKSVFEKFEKSVMIKAWLDDSNISRELENFLEDISNISDKIAWTKENTVKKDHMPVIEIYDVENRPTGIEFHGVPGGHEINSFVIALYNVAGPGTSIDNSLIDAIKNINEDINIKILVSLSCTMCPELVMAAQKIASISDRVSAGMYDLSQYPELKDKYSVMSVPCMIINDEHIYFGKKNIEEILRLLEK